MNKSFYLRLWLVTAIATWFAMGVGGLSPAVAGQPQLDIPTELQPWVPWVLYKQEQKSCTFDAANPEQRFCAWPAGLELAVDEQGAAFTQHWVLETRSFVLLPGNRPYWPAQVKANGLDVVVTTADNHPGVWLDKGVYTITGMIPWQGVPESLFVPPQTGIVKLKFFGKNVHPLHLDGQGRLWFNQKRKVAKEQAESMHVEVFRKIDDGVPLLEQLHIILTVSGNSREVTLGLVTGPVFIPLRLNSPLPVRLDEKGRLRVQVRPGQWHIELTLRNSHERSPDKIGRGTINGPWPTREIWVFNGDPSLRQVEVTGVYPVDPSRTSLPEAWKKLPAYLLEKDQQMNLIEKHRGNPHPPSNRLQLHRKIWLDGQGSGCTVQDIITGTMVRDWRLNVDTAMHLGRVEVEGHNRLITRLPGAKETGIEVRRGHLSLLAESRIEQPVKAGRLTFPAVGWQHTVEGLGVELNLPPGWKLLTTSGIDKVSTWLNRWTLLDIFLVLLIALSSGRILGWKWGGLALVTFVLIYHQPGSPRFLWIPLLALLALQQLVPGRGERIFRLAGLGLLLAIIITSVPFMVNEVRVGLYPQMEFGRYFPVVDEQRDLQNNVSPTAMDTVVLESKLLRGQRSKQKAAVTRYSLPVAPKKIEIDPQDMIQTGPGLPNWHWKTIHLSWNGPVRADQKVALFFLTPGMNLTLAFLRVILLTVLIVVFLQKCLSQAGKKFAVSSAVKPVLLVLFLTAMQGIMPQSLHAQVPGPQVLQELQQRLLAPPECGQQCASINNCLLAIRADDLQVTMAIDVVAASAVALPGKNRLFDQITIDGAAAAVLRLNKQGYPLIRLSAGHHRVVLKKKLEGLDTIAFIFPVLPARGQIVLDNWSASGLHGNGQMDSQISLHRKTTGHKGQTASQVNKLQLAPFVVVHRTVHMGRTWSMTNRVERLSPDTAIALDVPLLPGEKVTSEGRYVDNNSIRVNMAPDQQSFTWRSALHPVDALTLSAASTSSWTEHWQLDVSPIWHLEATGIPAISQTDPAGQRLLEYRPYPGEALRLAITRPVGAEGPVMTITRSTMVIKPGQRATETTLTLDIMASRGLSHTITLPPDVDIERTVVDGKKYPLQLEGNSLVLPLKPGRQKIEVAWRTTSGIASRLSTPLVDLGAKSVNASIDMRVPSDRWILLTGGPRIGPAVLFWGELLVIILVALLLGRINYTPLSTLQWLLLSLGLSQIPVPLAAVVVGWLLLLGLRRHKGNAVNSPMAFNLMQIALVLLTLAALGALFAAIEQGLLGHPDMQIGGNGSRGHLLRWYQDRSSLLLPRAWVVSVPLLVYRLFMLFWALWLAMSLLRWLRWGWDCFSDTAIWRQRSAESLAKKQKKNTRNTMRGKVFHGQKKSTAPE